MAKKLDLENLLMMIDNVIAGIGIFELNEETLDLLYMNEGGYRMLGYSPEEGVRYVKNFLSLIVLEDRQVFWQGISDILKDDGAVEVEFRTVTASGGLRWLQVRGNLYSRSRSKAVIVCVILDATDRKNVEEELRIQAERYTMLSEAEGEIIFDYNAMTDVATLKATHKKGFDDDILIDRYLRKMNAAVDRTEDMDYFLEVFKSVLKSPKRDVIEFRTAVRREDEVRWYRANLASVAGVDGYVTRVVGRLTDIHEKKLAEQELQIKAQKDALTGFYNKEVTGQLISEALAAGGEDAMHALFVIDLDNFKEVNDTLGHITGDEVLAQASGKMMEIFKGGDILGRIGGDEFAVFVQEAESMSDTAVLATRVCRALDISIPAPTGDIHVTVSIGIAICPYHGKTYEELFEKADKALYSVKAGGKAGHRIYDAATTLAYHVSRKNRKSGYENGVQVEQHLEDVVLQILYEDKCTETAIRSILELIATYYGLQKAALYLIDPGSGTVQRELVFRADGYEKEEENESRLQTKQTALTVLLEEKKGCRILHNYDELPDVISLYMSEYGIRSMIVYPMLSEGMLKGIITLEEKKGAPLELSKAQENDIYSLLRTVHVYVQRQEHGESVKGNITQYELLDNFDSYVYVVDVDTHEICFLNKKILEVSPDIHIGDLCYKVMRNQDYPCDDCIMKRLDRTNPHARWSEEQFNYLLRTWTKNHASWLTCEQDHATCLMNCMDISDYFIQ